MILKPELTPLPLKLLLAIFFTLIMQVSIPKLSILKLKGGFSLGLTVKTFLTISTSS